MKPFIAGNWQAWQGTKGILLSDEAAKKLREFPDPDACINWLFVNGYKEVARAMDKHVKRADPVWANPSMTLEGDFSLQIEGRGYLVEVVVKPQVAALAWRLDEAGNTEECVEAIEGPLEKAVMGFRTLAVKYTSSIG